MPNPFDPPPPIIVAAREFLALATKGRPPSERRLARALDRIALASHDMPNGRAADTDERPPHGDYAETYQALAKRFPQLGIYAVIDPPASPGSPSYGGDAIDDLADILADMREAVWRFEHRGADDAHWFLHLLRAHWERHLRELSLYLHFRRCQPPA